MLSYNAVYSKYRQVKSMFKENRLCILLSVFAFFELVTLAFILRRVVLPPLSFPALRSWSSNLTGLLVQKPFLKK